MEHLALLATATQQMHLDLLHTAAVCPPFVLGTHCCAAAAARHLTALSAVHAHVLLLLLACIKFKGG
jgi:hypothetical protein